MARIWAGRAVWSDDPAAAKVIRENRPAIIQAMKEDPLFGDLFDPAAYYMRPAKGRGEVTRGHR